MEKFCGQCGNGIKEGAKFCGKCGARTEEGAASAIPPVAQPAVKQNAGKLAQGLGKKPSLKTVQILSGICGVAVILLLGSIMASLFLGGYKKPIKLFVKGINSMDESALERAFYYEDWAEGWIDELERQEEAVGLEDLKIHIQIKEAKKIKASRLERVVGKYRNSKHDLTDVKSGYWVRTEFTAEGETDSGELRLSERRKFLIIKEDEEWKILYFETGDEGDIF